MAQISEMIQQSRDIITKPSVANFEKYETSGTLQDALIYVAIAAAISGLLGLGGGIGGLVSGVVTTLLGFFIFTYLVFWIGQQQGGTGSLDEVAYTFALFWVPISIIGGLATLLLFITVIGIILVPLVAIALLVVNVYFAYTAVQSSMNLPAGGKTWLVLALALVGSAVVNSIVASILT